MSASKILYVSEMSDHLVQHTVLDIVSPKRLDELLGDGWYICKDEKTKVSHPTLGKRVSVRRVSLSNDRGMTTSAPERSATPDPGMAALSTAVASLISHQNRQQGLPGETGSSYLGRSIAGVIPGVKTVTQFAGQGAFGMGADSAKSGQSDDVCPFPEGSVPFYEWMRGYLKAGGRPDPTTAVGIEEGRAAANGPKDAEVQTRHPANTRGYVGFVHGFEANGGRLV